MGWPELFSWLKGEFDGLRLEPLEGGLTSIRSFGDPGIETGHLAWAGLLPFPQWFLFKVEGPDAADYLHRRLSQSVKMLRAGEGARALQLAGDGRLQFEALVYRGAGAFWLLAPRENLPSAYTLTEKYVLMDNVTLTEQWKEEAVLGLAGSRAEGMLRDLTGSPAPQGWACDLNATIDSIPCRIFGDPRWSKPHFHIAAPHDSLEPLARALRAACESEQGGMAGEDAHEWIRIGSAIPRFRLDIEEETIPLEANLWDAIDFDKGCFPGQEVLARIRNLGHPARQLVKLHCGATTKTIAPGDVIAQADEPIGSITSVSKIADLGTRALGYVKWDRREPKRAVDILARQAKVSAVLEPVDWTMLASREAERARKEKSK